MLRGHAFFYDPFHGLGDDAHGATYPDHGQVAPLDHPPYRATRHPQLGGRLVHVPEWG